MVLGSRRVLLRFFFRCRPRVKLKLNLKRTVYVRKSTQIAKFKMNRTNKKNSKFGTQNSLLGGILKVQIWNRAQVFLWFNAIFIFKQHHGNILSLRGMKLKYFTWAGFADQLNNLRIASNWCTGNDSTHNITLGG